MLYSLLSPAVAVPIQLSQQGRLLDINGAAVSGTHMLSFRFYDAPIGGNLIWGDSAQIGFDNGYYSTLLGNNLSNPIDDSVMTNNPLYLEVELDTGGPIGIRKEIVSAPYARLSGVAQSVSGGSVDASSLRIDGQLIIDATGSWIGPAMAVNWGDVSNVPADLADGDDDALAGIVCGTGEILSWNGSQWGCSVDNSLTESEVEAFVTNDPLDFASGSLVGGQLILTEGSTNTLSGLSCQSGDLPKYDAVLGEWACGIDNELSESQVESYIANGLPAFDLTVGTTLGGSPIMTSVACSDGEVLSFSASLNEWTCSNFQALLDSDGDGAMAWNDCDDSNPLIGDNSYDADCDGIPTADDCNDADPLSESILTDGDCDGVLTADDCNDSDVSLGAIALDGDCDGVVTADDCDDSDSSLGAIAQDADCDGSLSADDCDDGNPNLQGVFGSSDCPFASCLEIQQQGFSTGSGAYTIDPIGAGAFNVYCDMETDGGGWTMVGAWGPMVGYSMKDYTGGILTHEVDDSYQTPRPSGGPTHYSREVINALFQNGLNQYLSLSGSSHGGYILSLHAKNAPDANYDPFKGVYHTSYMKDNGFTAYVDMGSDHNPLPLTAPGWSQTSVTGRSCPDNDSSGCYHYLPDDITSGSQWLFRENADDCPFSSNSNGPNVPSLLFIR